MNSSKSYNFRAHIVCNEMDLEVFMGCMERALLEYTKLTGHRICLPEGMHLSYGGCNTLYNEHRQLIAE